MYAGQTSFTQLMEFVPWTTFTRLVERYGGDHRPSGSCVAIEHRFLIDSAIRA
ncbi:MAG: hypothetical protein QOF70_5588 [Acetobacteraceae bacterium]|jgi:hypothetical protein|nr:hypothetical protein [Acetobacteraceae bacterium]